MLTSVNGTNYISKVVEAWVRLYRLLGRLWELQISRSQAFTLFLCFQVSGKDLLSTSMAANMEKEVASPVIEPLLPTGSLDDASEANKKLSNQTCNETDDPQAHQRNYRKRSVSESPEKSPEISPSSQKRKRYSDHRGTCLIGEVPWAKKKAVQNVLWNVFVKVFELVFAILLYF